MGRLRALAPLALILLTGCPLGIAGLECSDRDDCLTGESCERGVCVVFRADAAPAGPDASGSRTDAGGPDAGGLADAGLADAGPVDAGPVVDASEVLDAGLPDAARPDSGLRLDGGPVFDGGRPDTGPAQPDAAVRLDAGALDAGVDAGWDAGMLPDAATCGPNEEPSANGCVPVFGVTLLAPVGKSVAHGTALVKLERFPGTTTPAPTLVRLKLTRTSTGKTDSFDLVPSSGQYTGPYDLQSSGEYQVEASFDLNGTFAVTDLAQVKPTLGVPRPSYPPTAIPDPMFPAGCFVRGLAGTVFVPVDVENVTADQVQALVVDDLGNQGPATSALVPCASTADCPCTRTALACLALTSDFYAPGLVLEPRGPHTVHGGVTDDEGQNALTNAEVPVSRWRWAASLPPGHRAFAPPVVLPGGVVVVAAANGPAGATATTTVLLALDPSGAKVASSDPLPGTAVRLATRSTASAHHLAVVTQSLTGEDLYTGAFTGGATGLFTAFKQQSLGASGVAFSRVGIAWVVPAGAAEPVLAFAYVKPNDRNALVGSWDPATDFSLRRTFAGTLLSPALPVSAEGATLFAGGSDGGFAPFKFLPTDIQAGTVTSNSAEPATHLIGPGQAWVSQGATTALLYQPGLAGDSFLGQVLGLLGTLEGPIALLPGAVRFGKWGQVTGTPFTLPTGAPAGGVVAQGSTLYLPAPSQMAPGTFELLRRTSQAVGWTSWPFSGTPVAEPALDCLRGGASLGVLYVPTLDGRLVALVLDEPGLAQDAPWPQPGHDPGRSYNAAVPLACP